MRGHVLAASSLAMTLVLVNTGLVNVALPDIGRDLGADVRTMQWIVNAYVLALGSLMLSAGALVDRRGARRLLLTGVLVFAAGSLAAALSVSTAALIAAQAVTGLGAALLVPSSVALLAHTYVEPSARGRALGIWASVTAAAFAASPVLAGLLIELGGWRLIFGVLVPFAAGLAALAYRWVDETPTITAGGLDVAGQVLAAVALAALTIGLVEGGAEGWSSAPALVALMTAPVAAALFVALESRTRAPLLPLRMYRSAPYSAAVVAGALMSFAMFGQLFVVSLYLQQARGFSATEMGLAFAPQPAVGALTGIVAGGLIVRFGCGVVLAAGGGFGAIGFLLLTTLGEATGYGVLLASLVLLGMGFGSVVPALMTAAVSAVRGEEVGIASSALNAARQAGGALGVAVLGALVAGRDLVAGVPTAMGLAAVAMLGVIAMGIVIRQVAERPIAAAGDPQACETPVA